MVVCFFIWLGDGRPIRKEGIFFETFLCNSNGCIWVKQVATIPLYTFSEMFSANALNMQVYRVKYFLNTRDTRSTKGIEVPMIMINTSTGITGYHRGWLLWSLIDRWIHEIETILGINGKWNGMDGPDEWGEFGGWMDQWNGMGVECIMNHYSYTFISPPWQVTKICLNGINVMPIPFSWYAIHGE